jgi:DDE superfamily endonuclease/Helix-turn-helix of DDE superfamily endonuclease
MRMSYSDLAGKPKTLQSLTGLNPVEFSQLLEGFEVAWEESIADRAEQPQRQRAYGAGRKAELLSLEDKLLFILVYFRLYPTQVVQGYLFGLSQAQAHEWVHRLGPLLNQALGYEQCLPEREPSQLERVLTQCPSLEFLMDGTERGINRPKNKESQKEYYSGKKKTHTVKNNIITDMRGKVVFLSDTYEGKKHDKKIADEEVYKFPEGSILYQDTGFQGYQPAGVSVQQPKKKPRGGELSEAEKAINQLISKVRVKIEHHISGIKRCKIVVHKFRNHRDHYADEVMETACGLHNFRVSKRQKKEDVCLKTA